MSGSGDDLQAYLEPAFQPAAFRACRQELERTADLTQYTTRIAVDDLDDIRAALGYDQIHLSGARRGRRAPNRPPSSPRGR